MQGCRILKPDEVAALLDATQRIFSEPLARRNYALFLTMLGTGLRVGECRLLRVRDVAIGSQIAEVAYIESRYTKTKRHGSQIPLQPELRAVLADWLSYSALTPRDVWLFPASTSGFPKRPIFKRNGDGSAVPVNDRTVRKALGKVLRHCEIGGRVSTHSLRKTFGMAVYRQSGNDYLAAQIALRHDRPQSTAHYLEADHERVHGIIMGLLGGVRPRQDRGLEVLAG